MIMIAHFEENRNMCPHHGQGDSDSDSDDETTQWIRKAQQGKHGNHFHDGHSRLHHEHETVEVDGESLEINVFDGDPEKGKYPYHTHVFQGYEFFVHGSAIHDKKKEKHLWYAKGPIGSTYTPAPAKTVDRNTSQPTPSAPPATPSPPLPNHDENYMHPTQSISSDFDRPPPQVPRSPSNNSPLLRYSNFKAKQPASDTQNKEECCLLKCTFL